jgi:hypothetical protein
MADTLMPPVPPQGVDRVLDFDEETGAATIVSDRVLAGSGGGKPGAGILTGTIAPANSVGEDDDFYLYRSNNGNHYLYGPKKDGSWPTPPVSMTGPQGPKGDQGNQGVQGVIGPQGPAAPQNAKLTFQGEVAPQIGVARWYPDRNITLKEIYFSLGVAGSTGITIDVKKNGATIFSGPAPTLTAGTYISTRVASNVTLTPDDFLTVDIKSGSSGSFLTAHIVFI